MVFITTKYSFVEQLCLYPPINKGPEEKDFHGEMFHEVQAVLRVKSKRKFNKIDSSSSVRKIFKSLWDVDISTRESSYALYLNMGLIPMGYTVIGLGGVNSCPVDIPLVFQRALLCGASSIIIAHNHPSGGLKPSASDDALTKELVKAGRIMKIQILDHMIFTPDFRYYSYADNGRISNN